MRKTENQSQSQGLHWGTDDVTAWSEETLQMMWEIFSQQGTWERFPGEIAALQAEFARRKGA